MLKGKKREARHNAGHDEFARKKVGGTLILTHEGSSHFSLLQWRKKRWGGRETSRSLRRNIKGDGGARPNVSSVFGGRGFRLRAGRGKGGKKKERGNFISPRGKAVGSRTICSGKRIPV